MLNLKIQLGSYLCWSSESCFMTSARVDKDLLMWVPSLNLRPVAPVWPARSDPAKSTKFSCDTFTHPTSASPSTCSRDSIVWSNKIWVMIIHVICYYVCMYIVPLWIASAESECQQSNGVRDLKGIMFSYSCTDRK